MARRRTTLYLDDDLLQAAAERADLDEDESLALAYDELDTLRTERAKAT